MSDTLLPETPSAVTVEGQGTEMVTGALVIGAVLFLVAIRAGFRGAVIKIGG
jgi:hypothetical protein